MKLCKDLRTEVILSSIVSEMPSSEWHIVGTQIFVELTCTGKTFSSVFIACKIIYLCSCFTGKWHTPPKIFQNLLCKSYAANLSRILSSHLTFSLRFYLMLHWPNDVHFNDLKTIRTVKMPSEFLKADIWHSCVDTSNF